MLCKNNHFKAATLHSLKHSRLGHMDNAAREYILGASVLAPEQRWAKHPSVVVGIPHLDGPQANRSRSSAVGGGCCSTSTHFKA